ncbi:hypothetical protein BU23DRAFT_660318 [Bimuria novae-zelandiae CBS 107.79]|uniref:Uncharacterized protein n=1 Tax=Bimuria novae-zelandiae CBS 107.79 TaxID=1447943 RepID=A0A6A5UQK4_9PLEO|nr:hypothetical protein BU23DRAFT_660318 [Bimuria novae-zelandiae CBS 107.79]
MRLACSNSDLRYVMRYCFSNYMQQYSFTILRREPLRGGRDYVDRVSLRDRAHDHTVYPTPTDSTITTNTTQITSSSVLPSSSVAPATAETTTVVPPSSPTASTTAPSADDFPTEIQPGAIAGGVIGGCAILGVVSFWFWARKRQQKKAIAAAKPSVAPATASSSGASSQDNASTGTGTAVKEKPDQVMRTHAKASGTP